MLGFCCLPKRFFNFDVFGWDCFDRPPGYLDICLWSCILVIYASRIILLTVPISIQNFLSASFYLFRLLNTCFNKCIDKRYFLFFVFLLVVRDPYESAESI